MPVSVEPHHPNGASELVVDGRCREAFSHLSQGHAGYAPSDYLSKLVAQLSMKLFGVAVRVGETHCFDFDAAVVPFMVVSAKVLRAGLEVAGGQVGGDGPCVVCRCIRLGEKGSDGFANETGAEVVAGEQGERERPSGGRRACLECGGHVCPERLEESRAAADSAGPDLHEPSAESCEQSPVVKLEQSLDCARLTSALQEVHEHIAHEVLCGGLVAVGNAERHPSEPGRETDGRSMSLTSQTRQERTKLDDVVGGRHVSIRRRRTTVR